MAHEPESTPYNAIEALLVEERGALRAGKLAWLEEIASRKAALIGAAEIAGVQADPVQIRRIGLAAERNQALLAAAADGVRSALRRIIELRAMEAGKGTYE